MYDAAVREIVDATGCDLGARFGGPVDDLTAEALAVVGRRSVAWVRDRLQNLAVLNRALQIAPTTRKETTCPKQ
jgi:hypothetical protein